jgi:hypothetical protein
MSSESGSFPAADAAHVAQCSNPTCSRECCRKSRGWTDKQIGETVDFENDRVWRYHGREWIRVWKKTQHVAITHGLIKLHFRWKILRRRRGKRIFEPVAVSHDTYPSREAALAALAAKLGVRLGE